MLFSTSLAVDNNPWLFDQSEHTYYNDGDLFTCNDFNVWAENVYMKSINY